MEWGFSLGPGVGVLVRGGAVNRVSPPPFVAEELFVPDSTFTSATGWTPSTGSNISGGKYNVSHTTTTTLQALAGQYTRVPVSGEHLYVQFRLDSYTDGNIGPRMRFTDGTFIYFFGDQAGGAPLAGGDAQIGLHRSPTITIPVGKTFDRVEMRSTIRNTINTYVIDNFELWTSEVALPTRLYTA